MVGKTGPEPTAKFESPASGATRSAARPPVTGQLCSVGSIDGR
jgi:hypothetical protein